MQWPPLSNCLENRWYKRYDSGLLCCQARATNVHYRRTWPARSKRIISPSLTSVNFKWMWIFQNSPNSMPIACSCACNHRKVGADTCIIFWLRGHNAESVTKLYNCYTTLTKLYQCGAGSDERKGEMLRQSRDENLLICSTRTTMSSLCGYFRQLKQALRLGGCSMMRQLKKV